MMLPPGSIPIGRWRGNRSRYDSRFARKFVVITRRDAEQHTQDFPFRTVDTEVGVRAEADGRKLLDKDR